MTPLPKVALLLIPVLLSIANSIWPDDPWTSQLAAEVEQETCPSMKSKECWNNHAELKTNREYGFGLGQLTVTKSFNAFDEVKRTDPVLQNWGWNDRFNANYQLRALVDMVHRSFISIKWASDPWQRLGFAYSAYNGGLGGVIKDRSLCQHTSGCDPSKWFGNVAETSFKSKVAVKGYGQSFFEINRGYVVNIMCIRSVKYRELMPDKQPVQDCK